MQRQPLERVLIACVIGFFVMCAALGAQEILLKQRAEVARPVAEKEDADLQKGDDLAEKEFPNGASLKTDPELERLLKRAEQFVTDGRYDLASVLWQKVLDESGDTLMTRDGRMYTSLSAEVERTLARLPLDGLKLYRISADGEANAILASIKQGADEEEALGKVVRRYFMSSLGDDAAYKLGCLALDRHDFVGASRMFQAIIDQHPDPSMPRADVLLRLAVASAKVGDAGATKQSLTSLDADAGERPPHDTIAAVKTFIASAGKNASLAGAASHQWLLDYGNASRTGHMQALPKGAADADLAELWTQEFDVLLPQVANDPRLSMRSTRGRVAMIGGGAMFASRPYVSNQPQAPAESRTALAARWKSEGWFPTSRLLFDSDESGGRVYVKTATELTCWDTKCESNEPLWRSAWLNMYEADGGTANLIQMSGQGYQFQQDGPKTMGEILHFGDRVHSSVSISGDLIFNLEGKQVHRSGGTIELEPQKNQGFNYGSVPRRTRRNWLMAYEARTGKARWYRSADESDKEDGAKTATDIGFLAAPTPYGNLLLTPVTDGGAVWLYALNRSDGKTVWKTYLCDEPPGGANQWATVGVAVDGRDAYIACGTGAVFAVDAVAGNIRWAVRYKRLEKQSTKFANMYGVQNRVLDFSGGWSDDVVIPYGKLLVVMPSDAEKIFAIDRRTGEFAWDSPKDNATYCVGVLGRGLFVAGRDYICKLDMPSGRREAERPLNSAPRQPDSLSFGRGFVSEDGVYLPVKDSVLKLDPKTLDDITQVGVASSSGDPVGNLYADGDKLWIAGASKVSSLTNFDRRMKELAEKIAAGDATSQLVRMRMHRTSNHIDEAIADLEGAYKLLLAKDRLTAAQALVDGLKELQLPATHPLIALRLLGEAFIDEAGQPVRFTGAMPSDEERQEAQEVNTRRAELIYASLSTIRTKKVPGAVAGVLKLAPGFEQEYLVHTARKSLAASATSADGELLVAALASTTPQVVTIAADALYRVQGDAAKEPLTKLLQSDQDKIKFAGATALVNLGDHAALAPLVALLESADDRVASQSSATLRHVTGKVVAFSPSEPDLKKKGIAEWKEWLDKESATVKLVYPAPDGDPMLGRTLVCYYAQGKVVEYDENNKERWSANIQGVWGGQGLPNGNRLLALYAMRRVAEYNDKGEEIWFIDNLPGSPFNVRRLANGNTLVACSDSQKVVEFNREKKEVWSITLQGRPMDAVRLENGRTLVALSQSGKVAEYATNDKGELKEVWSCDGLVGAMSVERLENGNTLVACMNGGQNSSGMVVEIDPNKNHVWKLEGLRNPYDAQRLPNGNTLVTDNQRVQEVDSDKKVIWKLEQNGSSSAHRF